MPSCSYEQTGCLTNYLKYVFQNGKFDKMLDLRCSRHYKKLRWRCYIHNKLTINRFCEEMLTETVAEKTIVCFGDASFRHNSKGHASSPKQERFVKRLRQLKANVYMTNEYNTSQICSKCMKGQRLEDCKTSTNSHYVRRCTNKTCRTIWNRDVNAARNILYVGKHWIQEGSRCEIFSKMLPRKMRIGSQIKNGLPRC